MKRAASPVGEIAPTANAKRVKWADDDDDGEATGNCFEQELKRQSEEIVEDESHVNEEERQPAPESIMVVIEKMHVSQSFSMLKKLVEGSIGRSLSQYKLFVWNTMQIDTNARLADYIKSRDGVFQIMVDVETKQEQQSEKEHIQQEQPDEQQHGIRQEQPDKQSQEVKHEQPKEQQQKIQQDQTNEQQLLEIGLQQEWPNEKQHEKTVLQQEQPNEQQQHEISLHLEHPNEHQHKEILQEQPNEQQQQETGLHLEEQLQELQQEQTDEQQQPQKLSESVLDPKAVVIRPFAVPLPVTGEMPSAVCVEPFAPHLINIDRSPVDANCNQLHLCQFLLNLLMDKRYKNIICWNGEDGEFKLLDPEQVASLWGQQKGNRSMNYEKMSRALRYYYNTKILSKVPGKQFVYKFVWDLKQAFDYSARELNESTGNTELDMNLDFKCWSLVLSDISNDQQQQEIRHEQPDEQHQVIRQGQSAENHQYKALEQPQKMILQPAVAIQPSPLLSESDEQQLEIEQERSYEKHKQIRQGQPDDRYQEFQHEQRNEKVQVIRQGQPDDQCQELPQEQRNEKIQVIRQGQPDDQCQELPQEQRNEKIQVICQGQPEDQYQEFRLEQRNEKIQVIRQGQPDDQYQEFQHEQRNEKVQVVRQGQPDHQCQEFRQEQRNEKLLVIRQGQPDEQHQEIEQGQADEQQLEIRLGQQLVMKMEQLNEDEQQKLQEVQNNEQQQQEIGLQKEQTNEQLQEKVIGLHVEQPTELQKQQEMQQEQPDERKQPEQLSQFVKDPKVVVIRPFAVPLPDTGVKPCAVRVDPFAPRLINIDRLPVDGEQQLIGKTSEPKAGNSQANCNQNPLCKFLLNLLMDKRYKNIICWSGEDGEFKLLDPEQVASLWGRKKGNNNMNYDKMSRVLRYYYNANILSKVRGKQFAYKFVCDLKQSCGNSTKELNEVTGNNELEMNFDWKCGSPVIPDIAYDLNDEQQQEIRQEQPDEQHHEIQHVQQEEIEHKIKHEQPEEQQQEIEQECPNESHGKQQQDIRLHQEQPEKQKPDQIPILDLDPKTVVIRPFAVPVPDTGVMPCAVRVDPFAPRLINSDRSSVDGVMPCAVRVDPFAPRLINNDRSPVDGEQRLIGKTIAPQKGKRQANCNQNHLYKFLLNLLMDKRYKKIICWSGEDGEFKLLDPEQVASLWGRKKGNNNMNYDKMSRVLRYYYNANILSKVRGKQFAYKFVCDLKQSCGNSTKELNEVTGNKELEMNFDWECGSPVIPDTAYDLNDEQQQEIRQGQPDEQHHEIRHAQQKETEHEINYEQPDEQHHEIQHVQQEETEHEINYEQPDEQQQEIEQERPNESHGKQQQDIRLHQEQPEKQQPDQIPILDLDPKTVVIRPFAVPVPDTANCNQNHLCKFLLNLLMDKRYKKIICWSGEDGEFKLLDPEQVASLWGQKKGNNNMNYDKMSRVLRYYYNANILSKVRGKQFAYKFVCDLKQSCGNSTKELNEVTGNKELEMNFDWECGSPVIPDTAYDLNDEQQQEIRQGQPDEQHHEIRHAQQKETEHEINYEQPDEQHHEIQHVQQEETEHEINYEQPDEQQQEIEQERPNESHGKQQQDIRLHQEQPEKQQPDQIPILDLDPKTVVIRPFAVPVPDTGVMPCAVRVDPFAPRLINIDRSPVDGEQRLIGKTIAPQKGKRQETKQRRERPDKHNINDITHLANCNQNHLCKFLLNLLMDKRYKNIICWSGEDGEFKLLDPEQVASLWGQKKGNNNMNYDKMSRVLRYYYNANILSKVRGKQFAYKFVCDLKQSCGNSTKELNEVTGNKELEMNFDWECGSPVIPDTAYDLNDEQQQEIQQEQPNEQHHEIQHVQQEETEHEINYEQPDEQQQEIEQERPNESHGKQQQDIRLHQEQPEKQKPNQIPILDLDPKTVVIRPFAVPVPDTGVMPCAVRVDPFAPRLINIDRSPVDGEQLLVGKTSEPIDGNRQANGNQHHLSQFLLNLLMDKRYENIICWSGEDGEFKLLDPEQVASLWGQQKGNRTMNYDKMSRSLRYYYDEKILSKVRGKQFVYKFLFDPKQSCGNSARELNDVTVNKELEMNFDWECGSPVIPDTAYDLNDEQQQEIRQEQPDEQHHEIRHAQQEETEHEIKHEQPDEQQQAIRHEQPDEQYHEILHAQQEKTEHEIKHEQPDEQEQNIQQKQSHENQQHQIRLYQEQPEEQQPDQILKLDLDPKTLVIRPCAVPVRDTGVIPFVVRVEPFAPRGINIDRSPVDGVPGEQRLIGKTSASKTGNRQALSNQYHLCQFLLNLLTDKRYKNIICWIGEDGEFKLLDPEQVASLWGKQKGNRTMNYDKMSRALRYYYDAKILSKVRGAGTQFVYKFVCDLKQACGYSVRELKQFMGNNELKMNFDFERVSPVIPDTADEDSNDSMDLPD